MTAKSKEQILSPNYWRQRLDEAPPRERHHAIFRCPLQLWQEIEVKHKEILARHIKPTDSILDVGCGWGRLLTLLPSAWKGNYMGVDISEDFIGLARVEHPGRSFLRGNIIFSEGLLQTADWAILVSFRPMIKRHLGDVYWERVEQAVRSNARKLLYLEYDVNDPGSVE